MTETPARTWWPRHPRDLGKRGQILLIFGAVWVGVGAGVLYEGDPAAWDDLPAFSWWTPTTRGLAWIATGLIAIVYALRPLRLRRDTIAFVALYIMPAWRVLAFTVEWFGGYSRGWIWALTYGCMVATVMICASWPEPPRRHRGRP